VLVLLLPKAETTLISGSVACVKGSTAALVSKELPEASSVLEEPSQSARALTPAGLSNDEVIVASPAHPSVA
jgi:hypothetical protein